MAGCLRVGAGFGYERAEYCTGETRRLHGNQRFLDEYGRLVKERELTRRAAELLAADLPLRDVLARLAPLVRAFAGAAEVAFLTREGSAELRDAGVSVPIAFGGRRVGEIALRAEPGSAIDPGDVAALETLALQIGGRFHEELEKTPGARLRELAITDALTGLRNRRSFDESLDREWRRCARSAGSLALVMLDIDFFKRYNDAYGHVAGDACLRAVAGAIAEALARPGDVAARYGGEEFAIVLPHSDTAGAFHIAEIVCESVRALAIAHEGSSLGTVTISAGVASAIANPDGDAQPLVRAADEMLYAAKEGGRNRVAAGRAWMSEAPQVRATAIVRHNLPRFLTPILGRERQIAEVAERLREDRVVTVVGPGGIGKTRIAVEVAAGRLESENDGVWFVDLLPLRDSGLVAATAAAAIGIKLPANVAPDEALSAVLKMQSMLVVLDNCEHLVGDVAVFAERLARHCSDVRILATSREPLGIAGESVYRLETLDDRTALALFAARAQQAEAGFVLSDDGARVALEICRRLDGIALAIELAAARAHAMPLDALLASLPRALTLRASIDWSFDLLSDAEQDCFVRLGAFSGGFTAAAAACVTADCGDTLGLLSALTDKSMIAVDENGRFRLLDSMRRYALDRLNGDLDARVRATHAHYFAQVAAACAASFGSGSEDGWLEHYLPELDNFRAALDFSTEHDPELAAGIVAHLVHLWHYANLDGEGMVRSERALEAGRGRIPARLELGVLLAVARGAIYTYSLLRAMDAADAALMLARGLADEAAAAEARAAKGLVFFRTGRAQEGSVELEAAAAYFAGGGNVLRAANALVDFSIPLREIDPPRSRDLLDQVRALRKSLDWPRVALRVESILADVEFGLGNTERAIDYGNTAIAGYRRRKAPLELTNLLANISQYLAVAGRYDESVAAAREAVEIGRAMGLEMFVAYALQAIALCEAARGDVRVAPLLLGYVDSAYERLAAQRQPTEKVVEDRVRELASHGVAPAEYTRLLELGRSLTMEQACRVANGEAP